MRTSIQTKFLFLFALLVFLMTVGISATYYTLTTRDKHRESRQRIQVAFDFFLDGFQERVQNYTQKLTDFLQTNADFSGSTYLYSQEVSSAPRRAIAIYLTEVAAALKDFGHLALPNRLILYDGDGQLLLLYQRDEDQETVGGYVISDTETLTYFPMDDPDLESRVLIDNIPIPETPLPVDIPVRYDGEIPDETGFEMFSDGQWVGIQISTPVYNLKRKVGVLVSHVFYTQQFVERYVSLSKTEINLFAGNQFSVGTLPEQIQFDLENAENIVACADILAQNQEIEVSPIQLGEQSYYQGRCTFNTVQGTVGALAVSLSQDIEKKAISQTMKAILLVSAVAFGIVLALSVIFSRGSIHSIQDIVRVITAIAEGDLRKTAVAKTQDEIGMLAGKLNQMTAQLRGISVQVQDASRMVNMTADTILQEMDMLIDHMQQETTSVDSTTESAEKITQFIDVVVQNMNELLTEAAQILNSIQENRASIDEVTTSTSTLTTNLHRISSSVDQVNDAIKDISGNTRNLVEVAQKTGSEIGRINRSLHEVSQNATQSQQLAEETRNAALTGQTSVEASIQGITELKTVVANTAQIIEEVSSWGEQVSSILGIVDEITEQTALLSLNASIISAQAGVHGRGFAVVAEEIKELATRTKTSTQEIGTLVHALQKKTEDGVKNINEGMRKADEGVQLANAVKDALNTILDSATRSSTRATDTAQVVQQTTESSQIISTSMNTVTDMVSQIKTAVQEEEHTIGEVVAAVENIREMAEQVNYANVEQKRATERIEKSMEHVTGRFNDISLLNQDLKNSSNRIVSAMHSIETTTEKILRNTTNLSDNTVKSLLKESEVLRSIVEVFKVS